MGALYKRKGSRNWMMAAWVAGRQICKSTHTRNKRLARQMLARWETEIFEDRFQLPKSTPPYFEEWAENFLLRIQHANTRKRYGGSIGKALQSQLAILGLPNALEGRKIARCR